MEPKTTLSIPDSSGGRDHEVRVRLAATEQFAARLRKVARERRKWAKREGVSAYRLYDADLPDYALAIDWYERPDASETCVHLAEYRAPKSVDPDLAAARLADAKDVIPAVLGISPAALFCKTRERASGGSQYAQRRESHLFTTQEAGYRLLVDMNGYLDTGLFLDHRVTRGMVGDMAKGTRFLNLFAYTGTATVHAAGGGAASTTTVDLSQTYLDWAAVNMKANGFAGPRHVYERGDAMEWLGNAARERRAWDLVFADPPTFSNSKAMGRRTWDVQRDHIALLRAISRVLAPDGRVVFSNNLRTFRLDESGVAALGLSFRDITPETIPEDFKRNPKIHRCWVLQKEDDGR